MKTNNPKRRLARKMQTNEERANKISVYDSKAWQARKDERRIKVTKAENKSK